VDETTLQPIVDGLLDQVPARGIAVSVTSGSASLVRCRGVVEGDPVTGRTVFYAASVTKQLVGFLVALAIVDGRLAYRTRIADLLPGPSPTFEGVEVRHLLHHTSGLPDVTEPVLGPARDGGSVDNGEVVHRFRSAVPTRAPGEVFAYNNAGYVLLARLVEVAYGTAVEGLARRLVFDPLGMSGSRLGGPPIGLSGFADPPRTVGDGGLWTTVEDLTRWLAALNQRALSPAAVLQLEQPGTLEDGSPVDYGWGVRVTPGPPGRLVTHGGSWPGWLAKTVRVPERQVAVAVLSRSSDEQAISTLGTDLATRIAASPG
jgi:CubicO group peptidase (beta-lactamase class C family)